MKNRYKFLAVINPFMGVNLPLPLSNVIIEALYVYQLWTLKK